MEKQNSSNKVIICNLDKEEIVEKWLEKEESTSFSRKRFNENQRAILKIFGKKILEHLFDIVSEDKSGIFDTVVIIMDYFLKKKFNLVDLYRHYSNLKNVTLFYYVNKYPEEKEEVYYKIANLFDKNFTIFINEFLIDGYKNCKQEIKNEMKNIEISKKQAQAKKDIRFTTEDKMSAEEFVADLDYTVFDKVDMMLEEVDELVVLLYSLEDSNDSKKSIEIIEEITQYLEKIPELLVSLGVFEIIERAFTDLVEFLSTITEEMLQNKEKKALLVNLLLALVNDFESWLKEIFIEKSAKDIHYFDASFRANILNIENIFKENEEENNEEECEIEFF